MVMPSIFICERVGGNNLTLYEVEVPTRDRDADNEVRIELVLDNGDTFFLPIPKEDWSEFVRHCQKMTAVLA
jgi:hypothetical protein